MLLKPFKKHSKICFNSATAVGDEGGFAPNFQDNKEGTKEICLVAEKSRSISAWINIWNNFLIDIGTDVSLPGLQDAARFYSIEKSLNLGIK